MSRRMSVLNEPSIALGELDAVLELLDRGDVAGARELLAGWRPVDTGEIPSFIGQGLTAYVELVDRSVGLLGGFLRFIGTRDKNELRVARVHREFERFATRFSESYAAELDELEVEAVDEADELDAKVRREAARLAAAELAPARAAAFRRHLEQLVSGGGAA